MTSTSRRLALASAAVACLQPLASQSQNLDCMIQPSQVVQVGSPAPGVIQHIAVERGEMVTRGRALVQLNAGVERASLSLARERADGQGEQTAAASAQSLASSELQRANELFGEKFVSKTYLDKARAEAGVASGRSGQAEERRRQAEREVELAAAQLAQRTIRSPIDGVVVERYMSPGEFVDQKPVLRIAAIDPLRVDVLVPAAAFGQVQLGATGTVVPELLNRSEHQAVVKTVDRVIDAASNTFRVRLELRNPGGALPAGLRCKVNLGLNLPEAAVRDPRTAGQRSTKANPADNRLPAGSLATAATTARR